MKKWRIAALTVFLVFLLALPALADTMYVIKSCKAYDDADTSAHVAKKLKAGKEIEVYEDDGEWAFTYYGFVQSKYLSDELPQSLCKHSWGSWIIEQEATCTKTGYKYRYCQKCGLMEEKDIAKLNHSYTKWKVTKKATCTRQGTRTRSCKVCGHTETEHYYAEHDWGAWRTTRQPTCTVVGQRVRYCEVCGTEDIGKIEKLPHDYEWQVVTPTTDHSAGVRSKICRVCGYNGGNESFDPEGTLRRYDQGEAVRSLQQLLVDQGYLNAGGADGIYGGGTEKAVAKFQADQKLISDGVAWPQTQKRLNHDFGPWEVIKPMTRTEMGIRVRTCKDCGYQQRETISSGAALERGARGENVRALQQIVSELGYSAGSFDGIYGGKLDAALAGFAAANGFTVENGKIRPGDIDALMKAWINQIPANQWKGECRADSPVNLALTVTTLDTEDADVRLYVWNLTNMGSQRCMFNALLLNFGNPPDYRQDSLTMVLDGAELLPNSQNSASGSFRASRSWGEGPMNFAAMAVIESTGEKWLSNTVTFEAPEVYDSKAVAPMTSNINAYALPDGEYPVRFNGGDVLSGQSGIFMNAVHVFTPDIYDLVDINTLNIGDTIVISGEDYAVESVQKKDDTLTVNGDFTFVPTSDGEGYRIQFSNDSTTYTEIGATALTLSPNATITLDGVTTKYSGIVNAIQGAGTTAFDPWNTTVTLEDGRVTAIRYQSEG